MSLWITWHWDTDTSEIDFDITLRYQTMTDEMFWYSVDVYFPPLSITHTKRETKDLTLILFILYQISRIRFHGFLFSTIPCFWLIWSQFPYQSFNLWQCVVRYGNTHTHIKHTSQTHTLTSHTLNKFPNFIDIYDVKHHKHFLPQPK